MVCVVGREGGAHPADAVAVRAATASLPSARSAQSRPTTLSSDATVCSDVTRTSTVRGGAASPPPASALPVGSSTRTACPDKNTREHQAGQGNVGQLREMRAAAAVLVTKGSSSGSIWTKSEGKARGVGGASAAR